MGGARMWTFRFPVAAAPVLLLLLLVTPTGVPAAGAEEYGTPIPVQRIYDRAGVLSSGEITELEVHAERVEQAGAPTVVYLQLCDADYRQTEQNARDLMEVWDVQSAPGARDGLVIFLNLEPEDPQHGYVALFAGERHYQEGPRCRCTFERPREVRNASGIVHNFHVHLVHFIVLDVDGRAPPAHLQGWKDTAFVPRRSTVRLIARFDAEPDPHTPFMFHCHILSHEDKGMMGQFVVVEPGTSPPTELPERNHKHRP